MIGILALYRGSLIGKRMDVQCDDSIFTLIIRYYFLRKVHSTVQTPFTWAFPAGTHLSAESTNEIRIK